MPFSTARIVPSMGEQKEGGGKNAGDGKPAVEMKMEIHWDACAKKLKALVSKSSGKVDLEKPREELESEMHKKIVLVSPLPATDGGFKKKPGPKSVKKPDVEKPAPKKSTVALNIELMHCEGCAKKIKKITSDIEGVNSVDIDLEKDLMMVTGTMKVEDLVPNLQKMLKKKLKKTVAMALVQLKNDEGDAGAADKKEKSPFARCG